MKTINKTISLLLILLSFACSNSEPEIIQIIQEEEEEQQQPTLVPYLTIVVDNNYNTNSIPSEDWIMVHSENGDLYNYTPLQNGNTLVLEALDTVNLANMTITKLRVNDFGNKLSYHLESYGKVQPGRTWTLNALTQSSTLTELGQVDITVNNMPSWNSYTLTNTQDHSISELSQYMAYDPGFDPNIVDINSFSFKQANNYLMTIVDNNWVPKYSNLNGLTNGNNITVDGGTVFNSYDQLVPITISSSINAFSFNVSALNTNTNTHFQLYWTSTPNPNYVPGSSTSFNLGYLTAYQEYETNLTMNSSNIYYSFNKKGSPITTGEVAFPTATVTVTDDELPNYSFSTTANPLMNASRWSGGIATDPYSINWTVYGPTDESPQILEMPPVIDFPHLEFANITFSASRIFTQGDNYDIHTGRIFGDGTATTFNPIQEWFDYIQ